MTVRIWSSFSCNNSSAYRVVARFADPETAHSAGAALVAWFEQHERDRGDRDRRGDGSPLQALATKYGLDWEDDGWGGPDEGSHVYVEAGCVLVHHGYCLGLGPGVPAFLEERGAKLDPERADAAVHVSLLFRATPGLDPRLDEELATLLPQLEPGKRRRIQIDAPFQTVSLGRTAHFRDGGAVGLFLPVQPQHFASIKAWLATHGIDEVVMQLDRDDDEALFVALAKARCTACGGTLDYLDPRLHDIETPQLVCRPCGGLYEVSTFLAVTK